MGRYGIPYQGSKNKILKPLFCSFPKLGIRHFVDLFAGGCAVSHYALVHWDGVSIHANDIDPAPVTMFTSAVSGKFADERRWISREDFFRLKDTDPYVRICWSFGNNQREYMYSREREPWCKALHYARVFGDTSLFREFGIETDGSVEDIVTHHDEYCERYICWYAENILHLTEAEAQHLRPEVERSAEELRLYLYEAVAKSGLTRREVGRRLGTQMESHYFGRSQFAFPTREMYERMQTFLDLPLPYAKCVDEYAASLQRLQSLQSLPSLQRLTTSCASYEDVPIPPDSLVYCDIPYENTAGYRHVLDYERFYAWCARQTSLVMVSSYDLPADRFVCVWELSHTTGLGRTASVERLYIPRHHKKLYATLMQRQTFF